MKANGALNVMQGFIKGVSLPDNNSADASRIGQITIGVLFNDDLDGVNMRRLFELCKFDVPNTDFLAPRHQGLQIK
jgi:hypothetical protein